MKKNSLGDPRVQLQEIRGVNGFRSQPFGEIHLHGYEIICDATGVVSGPLNLTMDPSIKLQKALYQNISFVYWWAGFVLHVASKGR